ncbi:MAG: alpha-2-macroglobulin [Endomicrobia bacterium]|nr:alpha-2-macroglobulin [Endomicrobiia bacterium]MCL2507154.1 alpha-2-macroglobulin [Endomicrobiia bacterium]
MKKFWNILVITALVLIVLGGFFIDNRIVTIPNIYDTPFKSFHIKLTDKLKGKAGKIVYNDANVYINAPGITGYYEDVNGELKSAEPHPIMFSFNASAANIEKLGSEVEGITMSPKAEGRWEWRNEYTLVFTPKNDWPAGEDYKIKFPKDIFNPDFPMTQFSYTVSTPRFEAYLSGFNLFQDPKNPKTRQIQASFSFTHTIDTKSFEKALSFTLDKKNIKYTVTYDKIRRNAYVVSEPVNILAKDQTAVIELAPVKAASGGKASERIKQSLDIPSQDKIFRISEVGAVIVKNEAEDPEQFLAVNFTDGVNIKELKEKIEAYLLPLKHPLKENEGPSVVYDTDEGYYNHDENRYIEPVSYTRPYSHPWTFAEVTPEILAKSQKIKLEPVENASDISENYLYKYQAPDLARRYLYVLIKEDITSQTGFVIKKSFETVINSAAFPKEVNLLQNGAVLPLSSNLLTFKTRGVNGVKVDISRVMPAQINHLISQTYGSFAHPNFRNNWDFNESNISQKFTKTIPLTASISKANYSSIDLNEFLKPQGTSGLFFINIQAFDINRNSNDGPFDKRFILATDLAILVKKDITNRHNVFVMSIKNGKPVANAKVEILGKNGIPVLTQTTNSDGCAVFNKVEGFFNEKQPVAYVATSGNDISFMPFERYDRQLDFSKFSVAGEYSSARTKGLKAFIFSDRGIYRPGDDINFGMIVKDEQWSDISGIAIKTVLKDPYNKTVFEKTVSLNAFGFATIDAIKTYNTSPTGAYTLSAYLVKDEKNESFIGSAAIRVEEFRTDSIKVSAKITGASGTGWTIPENLKALITANNLFGTHAQNRMVKASYSVFPTEFKFSKYSEYKFPDPHKQSERNAVQNLTERFENAETDENGNAEFSFDLSKYSGGTYNLALEAEVFEADSGKSVYAYDNVRISPYKFLTGFKTISKLDYLNKGSDATVELIAVDNNLKPVELKNLTVRVLQKQFISSLVKQNNGVYKYQTSAKETLLNEDAFFITEQGSKLILNTRNPGNYVIEIIDGNGMKILSFVYFVAGTSNQSLTIEKDANLAVNLQSDDVAPGTQLTLNITAPYTGSGLITIEKDKVYAYKWFKTNTNSTVEKITVPKDLEGNAYVNVSFIRAIDSKEIFSSPHAYAVVPFKISLANRKIGIDLKTPELVRPGDEIEISYKTSQPAKIVVYAVDQGILQVAGYQTPSPLAFFFKKAALEVATFQTADLILPDFKIIREIAGVGGGEAYDMLDKNLNPFARRQAAPVVFWSSALDSTTEFKTVKYKVPDYFNGLLKVMAVAAGADKAGSTDKEVIVKSPVIISPMAPLAALPGDTFEVSATISNNIEGSKTATIEAWLETNDKFEITSENKQTFEIKEGSEKTVRFSLKALDRLGSGDLVFKAKHKDDIFKAEISVSIRPANVFQAIIKSGSSNKAKTKVDGFARNMYDEFSVREIAASHSPQLVFLSLKKYFNAYPYGCTEQIVSSVFPFLYGSVSERKGFITAKEQQEMFNNVLSKIRLRQQNNGGFSLWAESSSAHPFTTIYTLHFFTDAKELGYPVPPEILSRGRNWLENFASQMPASTEDAKLKAYANYVLTRNNYVTTNNLLKIEDYLNDINKRWREDITSAYMASCYMLLKDFKKAETLIKAFKPDTKDKFIFYSDFDSSSQRNAVYLYLCNKHFANNLNPDASSIAGGLVTVILNGQYNTISSSNILLALLSYGADLEKKDPYIQISVKKTDNKETDLTLNANPFPFSKFGADAKEFNITAAKDADRIYYSVIQQGFDRNAKDYANGLELTRDYLDSNGSVVKTAKLGDVLTARIRVRAKTDNTLGLAVVDMLPACFEIISGSQSGSFDSSDAREDRMIFHPTVNKNITELTYKVKVVTKGKFTVPGTYAAGMYDPEFSALTKQGKFEVVAAE